MESVKITTTNEDFQFGPIQLEWLKTLEDYPERQLKNSLGLKFSDGRFKCCCLGQLGLIAGLCEWNSHILIDSKYYSTGTLQSASEVGLNGCLGSKKGTNEDGLSYLNDSGKTWPEIAAIVRANPTAYFNKSV